MKDQRVEVYIPKGYGNEEPNLFVAVNGVNYLLPRGKKSLVPGWVAEEIARADRAREEQDRRIDSMTAEA